MRRFEMIESEVPKGRLQVQADVHLIAFESPITN